MPTTPSPFCQKGTKSKEQGQGHMAVNPRLSHSKTCTLIGDMEPMAPFHPGLWQSWGISDGEPRWQQKLPRTLCALKGWQQAVKWSRGPKIENSWSKVDRQGSNPGFPTTCGVTCSCPSTHFHHHLEDGKIREKLRLSLEARNSLHFSR